MSFGPLPFRPMATGRNLWHGQPIAPEWKRAISALIDYGIPLTLILTSYLQSRGQAPSEYRNATSGTDILANLLPMAVYINSGIIQGIKGMSLGKAIVGATLMTPGYANRLEVPGVVRASFRLVIPFLLYYFAYSGYTSSESSSDSGEVGGQVLTLLLVACYGMALIDSKRRSVFDHLTKTGVVDGRLGDGPTGPPGARRLTS